MSKLSSIEEALMHHFGSSPDGSTLGNIDLGQVIDFVNTLVAAAPAIKEGVMSAAPFVEAIVSLIKNGGAPDDAAWLTLRNRLDVNSAILASAEQEAKAEIEAESQADPAADKAQPKKANK